MGGRVCGLGLGEWLAEEVLEWRDDSVDGAEVKHWSRTQKARALRSGKAEYYAMVTGGAEGLRVWTDSSAAKAVANRRGLGKLRHVELKAMGARHCERRPHPVKDAQRR